MANNKKNHKEETNDYRIDALKERVKELNCLYGLTDIVKDKTIGPISPNQTLHEVVVNDTD